MRRSIIAGNWKMNGSIEEADELLTSLAKYDGWDEDVEVVVLPPFIYMTQALAELAETEINWGAQTVSEYPQGAYTGEVSAPMLHDFGCEYVLVGHSERRAIFHETNQQIAAKFLAALDAEVQPILCVGETQAQRDAGETMQVIGEQINAILSQTGGAELFSNAVIAYEPVWAIGTGKTATPEQAQEVHFAIRRLIAEQNERVAERLPILYGGSVKPDNAEALFAQADIDGGLIGGASLNADDFIAIYEAMLP